MLERNRAYLIKFNNMKSKLLFIALLCFILLGFNRMAVGKDTEGDVSNVLNAAEGLFKAMKHRDYLKIWDSITLKSKTTIIEDVSKAVSKSTEKEYSEEEIKNDFTNCGSICKSYWKGYLKNFNPLTVLEQSKWDMGFVKKVKAEINITYKKSEKPAVIKMFKEDGKWKVGLIETFWSRK